MKEALVIGAAATLASLLLFGCAAKPPADDRDTVLLKAGRASGVVKDAEWIALPLAKVRELEGVMHDAIMDGIDFREQMRDISDATGSTCRLPARYFAGLDEQRDNAMAAHRQARRVLDAPDLVQADGERILDLMLKALGAAAKAAK